MIGTLSMTVIAAIALILRRACRACNYPGIGIDLRRAGAQITADGKCVNNQEGN
jgi:hypothetical protein